MFTALDEMNLKELYETKIKWIEDGVDEDYMFIIDMKIAEIECFAAEYM